MSEQQGTSPGSPAGQAPGRPEALTSDPSRGAPRTADGPAADGAAADGSAADGPASDGSAAGSAAAGPASDGPAADGSAAGSAAGSGAVEAGRHARRGGFARELPFLVLVAFVLALLIKAFLIQAFYIPSGSMERTLLINDRVLVNKLVYRFRDIHRGEIVVFNGLDSFSPEVPPQPPGNALQKVLRGLANAVGVGAPGEKDFIKRVIGIPGDRVACCTDGHVTVQPKGSSVAVELNEPYVYQDDHLAFCAAGTGDAACPPGAPGILVPPGRLWVLGDHRSQSSDSRFHISDDANKGTVPADKVIGRAFVIVWPVNRGTILSVPKTFDQRALGLGPVGTGLVAGAPYAGGLGLGTVGTGLVAGAPYAGGLGLALPAAALRRRRRRRRLERAAPG